MTIKRNVDKTIPASHTIEMIFLTPENFDGGGIENILRVALKGTEEAAGNPLLGIPVKITDGYFLVALNDTKAEIETNLTLLKREQWIDVPLVYKSGRRALFTMEKGVPGDKVFDEAIKAWQTAARHARAEASARPRIKQKRRPFGRRSRFGLSADALSARAPRWCAATAPAAWPRP